MTPTALLAHLRCLDVSVRIDGESLVLAPAGALSGDLLEDVRANKPGLLAALREIDGNRRRYDFLLAHFLAFPDTPAAVASREWEATVAELNRVLAALAAVGWEATSEEIRRGFGTVAPREVGTLSPDGTSWTPPGSRPGGCPCGDPGPTRRDGLCRTCAATVERLRAVRRGDAGAACADSRCSATARGGAR